MCTIINILIEKTVINFTKGRKILFLSHYYCDYAPRVALIRRAIGSGYTLLIGRIFKIN